MTDLEKSIQQSLLLYVNAKQAASSALSLTDWTQIPNSGLTSDCVAKFEKYRESIRVIRVDADAENKPPSNFTWPSIPTEEWS